MRLGRFTASPLLAVLGVAALVLAACGSPDDPTADPADPEPTEDEEVVEESTGPEVTAYVVGYHWGWAVFDENGSELDALRVPVGTTVELFAVNDHATEAIEQLPPPVSAAIQAIDWTQRAHDDLAESRLPDPMDEMGMSLDEMLGATHDGGPGDHGSPAGQEVLEDHALMIPGLGAQAHLDAEAAEPQHLRFDVEEEGAFAFVCASYCGYGHAHQQWNEMLVVQAT